MKNTYKGSCLCGCVQFEVESFREQAAHCHCTMCRKFHGAAFGTLATVNGLLFIKGLECIKEYQANNGAIRSFCENCGSSLGFRAKGFDMSDMEIALGCFDEPIPAKPDAHIYVDYKAEWYPVTDSLPQHREGRDS